MGRKERFSAFPFILSHLEMMLDRKKIAKKSPFLAIFVWG